MEPEKEAQHGTASATKVTMLWEVLKSGSSTPHPSHQKTAGRLYKFETAVSSVHSGKLLGLLQCLQSYPVRQTWKGKSAVPWRKGYIFSWPSSCLSEQDSSGDAAGERKLLFTAAACFTQLQRRISAEKRNQVVSGRKSWTSVQKAQMKNMWCYWPSDWELVSTSSFKSWEVPIPTVPGPSCPAPLRNGA